MTTQEDTIAAADPDGWISSREGGRRMGLARVTFVKVAEAGGVRRRQYPGLPPSYSAVDVQRLIDQAITTP